MRSSILRILLSGCAFIFFAGQLPPLTIKEISLMLRSGYSAEAVHRELVARRFMETVDAAAEKNLIGAGAPLTLIAGLKTGTYAIPPDEVAAMQADLAAKNRRRAAQIEESQKLNTLYQSQLAQARAAAAAGPAATTTNPIAALVKGDLVRSKNGILSAQLDEAFEKKKLIGLYFSAQWCGPCRKFTPELVAYYNRNAAAHPEFEILFISHDKSAPAMQTYMRDMQMPWPAVSFEKIPNKEALTKYAGSGIPCLVLVDPDGKVISDSYEGKTYRGPSAVLAELDQVLSGGKVDRVALKQ